MPTPVTEPVAVTEAVSPCTSPDSAASSNVSGMPSYSFSAEPVVTFSAACPTLRVPSIRRTPVNSPVTSAPSASRMRYQLILLAPVPASVWLPAVPA